MKKKSKKGSYKPKFSVSWHRYLKRFVAKKVMKKKSYQFLRNIALDAYYRAIDSDTSSNYIVKKRARVTPCERPPREDIIEKSSKYSRMT